MEQKSLKSELILGIITTTGTDIKEVMDILKDQLAKYKYSTKTITVSGDIISKFSQFSNKGFNDEYDRISFYMDAGNLLRKETKDNAILMRGVCAHIAKDRIEEDGKPIPQNGLAYIIKSLKNTDEIDFMRNTYGDGFHLIGITSSRENRINYLHKRKGLSEEKAEELLKRDEDEEYEYGQHTRDAFQQSDYFIDLNNDNGCDVFHNVERLLDLLFGNPFISPTFEEYAMFMAYANSIRSADLSRQIGAVIARNDEIIASGTNDCPRFGGGLYWPIFENKKIYDIEDGRDYKLGYDSNKIEQMGIINSIIDNLGIEKTNENIKKIKKTGIGNITEYGRVVHAEMEALMMCARNNISCRGASLIATTFPCHNCAKHIIAAGIKRVVYIEPYPKSKAFKFYKNEISDKESEDKVQFVHFVGVGPHKFMDLFSVDSMRLYAKKRKGDDGYTIKWKREEATLRTPMNLLTYIESEQAAFLTFEDEVKALKEEEYECVKS